MLTLMRDGGGELRPTEAWREYDTRLEAHALSLTFPIRLN